ncbi:MAG: hypothetical protein QOH03_1584, partial [Kribbellaceae bacterium]|nr:hypothetical protein [Kribbellaceae bacterium]
FLREIGITRWLHLAHNELPDIEPL